MSLPNFHALPMIQTSLGSVITPVIALAAAVSGEERYTKLSALPCLPLKLRFDVESETSPGAKSPKAPPIHGPQHGASTNAPASTSFSISPAFRTFMYSALDAGTMITRTSGENTLSPRTSAASAKSSYLPLVHD